MARTKQTANKAEAKLIALTVASHPALLAGIEWNVDGQCWTISFAEGLGLDTEDADSEFGLDEVIANALEQAQEALDASGEETSLDDDSEGEVIKSIVPHKYRNEYKARGDARSCGDWLALTLRQLLNGGSKKAPVDLIKTYALARANGCDKEWPSLNPGQQRMNAGNAIRRAVKAAGFLVVPAELAPDGVELKLYP